MMNQNNESSAESFAVKAFRAKLLMAKINVKKNSLPAKSHKRPSGHLVGEFNINNLPLLVKKHIINAGVVQGEIFDHGDGFAYIKEVVENQGQGTSAKTLFLVIHALTTKPCEMAIGVVETLIDDILDPQKKTLKRQGFPRSWATIMENEFEIENLMKPVISYVVTKGIIKGEIYQASGAVVSVRGSPYLAVDLPQKAATERPIHLLVRGPNKQTLSWAIERIHKLIQEAEEFVNNIKPETASPLQTGPPIEGISQEKLIKETSGGNCSKPGTSVAVVARNIQYPPFMPSLGQTVDGNVQRCTMLVQWLLAHPLLVSFMARPPRGCESKNISQKLTQIALTCLPLYQQFRCPHLTSAQFCGDCNKFLSDSYKSVQSCFKAVVNEGYDISKLILVDEYIKQISDIPERITVLYDYPLPKHLFWVNTCRLFIDLIVECGFSIDEQHVGRYLSSTDQWYPVPAFNKIVVGSKVTLCPTRNAKTYQYTKYTSGIHQGGLVNFRPETIANAIPGGLFPADASKIPRCSYFPFLLRLSVFSELDKYNKMSRNVPENPYQSTRGWRETDAPNLPSAQESGRCWTQQLAHPGVSAEPPADPSTPSGSSLTPQANSDPFKKIQSHSPSLFGSLVPSNLEQALSMMQEAMPALQPTLLVAQSSMATNQENKPQPLLKPAILDAGCVSESQLSDSSHSSQDTSQPDPFEDVISKLQEVCSSQNPFVANLNLPTLDVFSHLNMNTRAEDTQKLVNSSCPQMPSSFTVMQHNSSQPPNPPQPKPNVNPNRLKRKLKRKAIEEEKRAKNWAAIDSALEKLKGKNSFWTQGTSSEMELEKAEEKRTNLLVEERSFNESNLTLTNQTPGLLTGAVLAPNVQLAPNIMQTGMPQVQTALFGAQSLASMNQENISWPTWKTPEQVLGIKHVENDVSNSSQDSLQINSFSDTISKLKKIIHSTESKTDEIEEIAQSTASNEDELNASAEQASMKSGLSIGEQALLQSGSSLGEQTAVSTDTESTTALSAVIQQLQQFIDSKKTASQDERSTPSRKSEEVEQNDCETEKRTFKRKPDEPLGHSSLAKHFFPKDSLYVLTPRNSDLESRFFTSKFAKKYIDINKELSILGDCLVQDARNVFGGKPQIDCRKNKYTVKHLTIALDRFASQEDKLKRYCLIMCGAMDLFKFTKPENFIAQYKILVNYLVQSGYCLLLTTLPRYISAVESINENIPIFNSLILSLQNEANVTIIPFHEMSKEVEITNLFKTVHLIRSARFTVLSETGCKLIERYVSMNRF